MAGESRFRPAHRIGRATGFDAVFSSRQVLRGKVFDLHYSSNALGTARIGLVVPKRLVASAVMRNRVKRLAREFFRCRRTALPCLDLVLRLARLPAEGLPKSPQLRSDIDRLFQRLPQLEATP